MKNYSKCVSKNSEMDQNYLINDKKKPKFKVSEIDRAFQVWRSEEKDSNRILREAIFRFPERMRELS